MNAKMVVVIPNSDILRPILLIEPAFQFFFRKEQRKKYFSFAEQSVMAFLLSQI